MFGVISVSYTHLIIFVYIVAITGEWSDVMSSFGSTLMYPEDNPFITKKSRQSEIL